MPQQYYIMRNVLIYVIGNGSCTIYLYCPLSELLEFRILPEFRPAKTTKWGIRTRFGFREGSLEFCLYYYVQYNHLSILEWIRFTSRSF